MQTKTLSAAEFDVLNARFDLDLSYSDATHYRAAQVIWALNYLNQKTEATIPDQEDCPVLDTPTEDQAPADIA
jgi:hypothetical protein